nr:hypothetical protein [Tanacetum cinerariifolium]
MSLHGYSDGEYDVGGDDDNVTLSSKLDVSHPLHLHLNDSMALTVVSVKLKGTQNYQVWSCAMLLALEGKNKIGFIDGSCRRSTYVIISSEEFHRIATGSVFGTSQRPNDNRNRRTARGSTLIYENCGFNGHTTDRCFKIIGYPIEFGKRKAGSNLKGKNVSNNVVGSNSSNRFSDKQIATLISLIKENFVNGKGIHANMVGANQHITYIDKNLTNFIDVSYLKIKVTHPNETEAFITKIGNMPLTNYLTLYDVLVMPEYYDLREGKILGTGKKIGGLYYFDGNQGSTSASSKENDARHSQNAYASASENGSFAAYEKHNSNSE